MGEWQQQTIIGLLGGGGAFVAIFLPIIALQFRRYGRISVPRLVGAAAVSIYAVTLLAYTLLPLPATSEACAAGGIPAQVVPFAFIGDIAKDTHDHGTSAILVGRATRQVVLNVLLFLPLGVIARRFWSFGVLTSSLVGLAASIVIEATQLTGNWGLSPCAYRVADVDDLLANTMGALLGALIAPILLWWMPRARDLRSRRLDPRPVTVWRRWFGMAIDFVAFTAVSTIVAGVISGYRLLSDLPIATSAEEDAVTAAVAGVAVFLLPALVTSGASIGQRLVWLVPVTRGGARPGLIRRLVRTVTIGGTYTVSVVLGSFAVDETVGPLVIATVAVLSVPVTRGRRGLSGVFAGVEMVDSRARARQAAPAPFASLVP